MRCFDVTSGIGIVLRSPHCSSYSKYGRLEGIKKIVEETRAIRGTELLFGKGVYLKTRQIRKKLKNERILKLQREEKNI